MARRTRNLFTAFLGRRLWFAKYKPGKTRREQADELRRDRKWVGRDPDYHFFWQGWAGYAAGYEAY